MALAAALRGDDQAHTLPLIDQPLQARQGLLLREPGIKRRRFQRAVEGGRGEVPMFAYHWSGVYREIPAGSG